ncbi:MAG: hypothetical protein QOF50_2139, partial [Gaiellaceae bacterium]|nr:hypothetical protein [Gaiellaceae bacterium]
TMARELGRPVSVDEVRPHAATALAEVFGFDELAPSSVDLLAASSAPA